ncbi:MAG: hypothetical protein K8R40_02360 [Anaerolineaceae bacterium]|nr:hypothetical protein [Anaerolineaceae bacterium]
MKITPAEAAEIANKFTIWKHVKEIEPYGYRGKYKKYIVLANDNIHQAYYVESKREWFDYYTHNKIWNVYLVAENFAEQITEERVKRYKMQTSNQK